MVVKPGAPVRVTLSYLVFAGLWIFLSDRVLTELISDPLQLLAMQTYKGWVFVMVTGVLLFLILRREEQIQNKANQMLQRYTQELELRVEERTSELQSRNRELQSFAYSVSHDLKAPLRGIEGYSRLLLEGHSAQLGTEGASFVNSICLASAQMSRLIDDLLAYSQLEWRSLVKYPVDLPALADRLISERRQEIQERRVDLVARVECGEVLAEVEGLAQALRNLLDNALKFTAHTLHPRIEIGSEAGEQTCRIWVRDNGIGFDMRYQDRIFEIFHRLHPAEEYAGTGIGLAIVRLAMQRMGGRVWVESQPGRGSTFFLELPR